MKRTVVTAVCGIVLAGWVFLSGCGGPVTSSRAAMPEGAAFLLSQEPAGALDVVACREMLEASSGETEVVLVGRIGGLSQPTWESGRAAFMIADVGLAPHEQLADGAPRHDADNCPFCRAKQKKELASSAMVQLIDAQGNVPAVSAQTLLGLEEGQTVVLQGTARLDSLGILAIQARGVFLRRESVASAQDAEDPASRPSSGDQPSSGSPSEQ